MLYNLLCIIWNHVKSNIKPFSVNVRVWNKNYHFCFVLLQPYHVFLVGQCLTYIYCIYVKVYWLFHHISSNTFVQNNSANFFFCATKGQNFVLWFMPLYVAPQVIIKLRKLLFSVDGTKQFLIIPICKSKGMQTNEYTCKQLDNQKWCIWFYVRSLVSYFANSHFLLLCIIFTFELFTSNIADREGTLFGSIKPCMMTSYILNFFKIKSPSINWSFITCNVNTFFEQKLYTKSNNDMLSKILSLKSLLEHKTKSRTICLHCFYFCGHYQTHLGMESSRGQQSTKLKAFL